MKKLILLIIIVLAVPSGVAFSKNKKTAVNNSKAVFIQVNPHKLMFDGKKINHDMCLLCHKFKFNSNSALKSKKQSLNAEVNDLCRDCHSLNPHPAAMVHLGKPDRNMAIRIKQWEKKNKKKLWLSKKGEITCSTCHNMHPKGLFSAIDEDFGKNYKSYMQRYFSKEVFKSDMFADTKKRLERINFNLKKRGKTRLPFREDMSSGKFCKVCHDLK